MPAQQKRLTARELYNVSVLMAMFIWGHSLQVRDVLDMFAYPPKLIVTADIPGRQLRARKRHMQCGNIAAYSITSARASSVAGTSRPSALAALRLMISSIFVDCTTGRSAGFAP